VSVREQFELTNKNAIVTGAGGGIGRELCHALAEMGANLGLVDTNRESIEKLADELKRYGKETTLFQTDVSKEAEVEDMVAKALSTMGSIDILVNCAGIFYWGPPEEIQIERWDRVLDVNLKGTFLCCRAVGRSMIANRRGKIINIASISASIVNRPANVAYNVSKAGVVILTKTLAADWAQYNVNVNSISPGYMSTGMTEKNDALYGNEWRSMTPMHRLGDADELKGVVVFLASDASKLMTGQDVILDGGFTLW
jgi:NAD(P)-dependent dehydrogenase (short-subunit alcohol dehydrogenase family)